MRNIIKTVILLLALFVPLLSVTAAGAEQGWAAKVQVINVDPRAKSSIDGLDVDSNVTAVINATYYFNRNLAVEVLACCYTRHQVTLGDTDLGKLSLLPPTVTAQYHLPVNDKFIPYAGVGFNFTRFFNVDLATGLDVDKTSTGVALQAGFNVPLNKNAMINFDVKKIQISTEVTAGGAPLTELDIDPLVIGIGYSWRL